MRKLLKLMTSKFLLVCLLLLVEIALLPTAYYLVLFNANGVVFVSLVSAVIVFDFFLILYIVNSEINAEYKVAWLVPILFLPPVGGFLYLTLRRRKMPRRRRNKIRARFAGMRDLFYLQDEQTLRKFDEHSEFAGQCARTVYACGSLPAADCYEAEYFPSGEAYCAKLIQELQGAQKFIFLEYFVIAPGALWSRILAVLEERAAAGVEVRVIYDDIGSMLKLPSNYPKKLEKRGIHCQCFNRFRPILDVAQNNRTHRKIAVIDGLTAFTGGVNLGDEYVNLKHPFGHWKDTGVMLRGNAVKNFTAMFLQLWSMRTDAPREDYSVFDAQAPHGDILCLPFCDSPMESDKNICEDLYLKLIYNAKKSVYICTPYLILDGEMKRALISAARAGVDVRIIVPHIPDKKYVFSVTKAFYTQLVKEGVRVYRYRPGFIHAKSIVCDGQFSLIGSSNMDFRSFYLHFECDVLFFDEQFAQTMEQDFLNTCALSLEVTRDDIKSSLPRLLYRSILRIFAPLM